MPSFPLEPSATSTEPAGLQPGEFVAAAGATKANRELVAYEFAATTDEDWRTAAEARTVLLALTGGEPSDEAALQEDGAADRGAVASGRIAEAGGREIDRSKEVTEESLTRPDGKAMVSSTGLELGRRYRIPSPGRGQGA